MDKISQWQQQFADVMSSTMTSSDFAPQLKPASNLSDRLALYRGNQSAIWGAALQQAYPVLYQLVGLEFFEQMARAYGQAHPSQSGNLHYFGSHLAEFLSNSHIKDDYPYFAEVARLEWGMHLAYYAADALPLTLPALMAVAAESEHDLQKARLLWNPAAALFESRYSVVDIWHAHQSDEIIFPETIEQRNYGIISRPEWRVRLQSISKADHLALNALQHGSLLGDALDVALSADAEFNIAQSLQTWFAEGLFIRAEFSQD
ncbi:putative DNA-binding domain-containing protein [Undibacterium sp. SXout7W]|uniref:HvfC/BufC family peptide modification chaperone n=1 Tax=Undibacterium sp. SXout7W TaxID=3413049 RepID=UPI003BF3833D